MIRFQCPGCGSNLSAKHELAGQARPCPKCKTLCAIPATQEGVAGGVSDETPAPGSEPSGIEEGVPAEAESQVAATARLTDQPEHGHGWRLERLIRVHRYLICDRTRLVANWENDGQGWLLKTNAGLVSAVRNRDKLPTQGDFKLVELKLAQTPTGMQLTGICSYQLAKSWALANLARGDDLVVRTITGYGSLNRDQKNVVRQVLREHFMREVWERAQAILDYLGNNDFHSHGIDMV